MDNSFLETIRVMPKVELHLHLEGAFTFEFLFDLIQKYGDEDNINSIVDLQNKFEFVDFNHLIQTWFWKNKFYRTPDDFKESTYETVKNLSSQNVIYAEVFFSPWDFTSNNLNVESITEATIEGIKNAERDFPIKCSLITDIVRNHGAGTAINRLNKITPYLNNGITGIGLGGDEFNYPASDFKNVFMEAKRRGFRLTAHAGEADGPQSIWSSLIDLQVERIGHGVRAVEDPLLVDYLLGKNIPLEVCITSNLKTKVFQSVNDHPFKYFFEKGLRVTINSDDPPMFGSNITDEFELIHKEFNYSENEISKLTKTAIDVSFLSESEKKIHLQQIDSFWKNHQLD